MASRRTPSSRPPSRDPDPDFRQDDNFSSVVLSWFKKHGRHDLPWQKSITAYRVWLSEIMLQQTQVKTVIPYFERFTQRFPTIESLADAPQDEVLHLWTGLGYYARARNLHAAAKKIMSEFSGIFPDNILDIISLPGIGRSTAGAISSIVFNKAQPILDGNVKRVLSRYFAENGDLWDIATKLTPEKNCADYTQAMMDLGATICTRTKPKCDLCPLKKNCQAHALGQETDFPPRKAKKTIPVKKTIMLLLQNTQGEILLIKQPSSGIWGGLWLLPQCVSTKEIKVWCQEHELDIKQQTKLPAFRHTFSHYHLDIQPIKVTVASSSPSPACGGGLGWGEIRENRCYLWYNGTQQIGLPKPVKALIETLTLTSPTHGRGEEEK